MCYVMHTGAEWVETLMAPFFMEKFYLLAKPPSFYGAAADEIIINI